MRGHERIHQYGMGPIFMNQYGMGSRMSRPRRVAPDQSERNEDTFVPIVPTYDPVVPFTLPAYGIPIYSREPIEGTPLTETGKMVFRDFESAVEYYMIQFGEAMGTDPNQPQIRVNAIEHVRRHHPYLPEPSSSGTHHGSGDKPEENPKPSSSGTNEQTSDDNNDQPNVEARFTYQQPVWMGRVDEQPVCGVPVNQNQPRPQDAIYRVPVSSINQQNQDENQDDDDDIEGFFDADGYDGYESPTNFESI